MKLGDYRVSIVTEGDSHIVCQCDGTSILVDTGRIIIPVSITFNVVDDGEVVGKIENKTVKAGSIKEFLAVVEAIVKRNGFKFTKVN